MKSVMKLVSTIMVAYLLHATVYAEDLKRVGDTPLKETTPAVAFKYFSGHTEVVNNHPAIYAHGYKENSKLTVVGPGFYKESVVSDRFTCSSQQ